jgi:hypothetical protein
MEMESMLRMIKHMMAREEEIEAKAEARQQWAEARQEKANAERKAAYEELTADLKAMVARMAANRAEMLACPDNSEAGVITSEESSEQMDATRLEANPEETEAAMERQDLFKEKTYFDNIVSSEDRCEEQRLFVRRRRGAKKRTQDSFGSRQKLSAARKREIRRAISAVRKGNIRKGPGMTNIGRGVPTGRRLEKIRRRGQECSVGIRNRGLKDQLCLRMKRTSQRIARKPRELTSLLGLHFEIREVNENAFWKVRPLPRARRMCGEPRDRMH